MVSPMTRALLERRARVEAQLPHRIEEPTVHRLETVARIGQRPVHDGGERIGEIALLECLAQRDFLRLRRLGGNQLLAHGGNRYSAGRARTTRGAWFRRRTLAIGTGAPARHFL